ncbi:MAG: carboxypeptidase-like regulatory domain-containing protein [Kofleriaceae bacterium]
MTKSETPGIAGKGMAHGFVRTVAGVGVANAQVYSRTNYERVTTAANGEYTFTSFAGRHALDVTSDDGIPGADVVVDLPDGARVEVDFVLEAASAINGRIVDADGKPVSGARIQAISDGGEQVARSSAEDGTFRIARIRGAEWRLSAIRPRDQEHYILFGASTASAERIEVPAGGEVKVTLTVESAHSTLRGVIVDAHGAPVPDASFCIARADSDDGSYASMSEHNARLNDVAQAVKANADGTFEVADLFPGPYGVRAFARSTNQYGTAWSNDGVVRVVLGER